MPMYDYRCDSCGLKFEKKQKMTDEPVAICPECGSSASRQFSSNVAILMGGSGSRASVGGRFESCSRETPCCGRATPCEKRPCE